MLLAMLYAACAVDCGSASYVTEGDARALWDEDGDGTADLMERCGADWGSFGLRLHDLGLTTLTLSPNVPSRDFDEDLEVATYLLPGAELTFYTAHLEAGATLTVDQIGGFGLSKLHGTVEPGYVTYGLLDATVVVLDGPGEVPGAFDEDEAERWELQWDAVFGDVQTGATLQEWHATDVVDVANGTEVGDPAVVPPDWTGALSGD
ncbi:MAG: hypothetical protein ABMB14_20885 [Myxococcota bacterium]